MSYLVFCNAKNGVTNFVSEIKRAENYPDFEKLARAIQYGVQGLPTFSQNLTLQKPFETVTQISKELERMDLMVHFAKKISNVYSIDVHFFAKCRILAEKVIHEKKVGATECPRMLNPGKATCIAMAICPIAYFIIKHGLMHDVVGEFVYAVRTCRNNWCECP